MDYVCLVFLPRRVFDFLKDYFILGSILVYAMPEGSGYELLTLTASVFGGESVFFSPNFGVSSSSKKSLSNFYCYRYLKKKLS